MSIIDVLRRDILLHLASFLQSTPSLVHFFSASHLLHAIQGVPVDLLTVERGVEYPFCVETVRHLLNADARLRLVAIALRGVNEADLDRISQCRALATLSLYNCINVTDVTPLSHMEALSCLNLGGTSICDLYPISRVVSLQRLFLKHCNKIQDLGPLGQCKLLITLLLSGCTSISDVSPLASCQRLQHLSLDWCWRLTSVNPLSQCKALQRLSLTGWRGNNVDALQTVSSLRSLDLSCVEDECMSVALLKAKNANLEVIGPFDASGYPVLLNQDDLTD